jgi:hypothetical protein
MKQEIDNRSYFLYIPIIRNTDLFNVFQRANPIVPVVAIQFTQKPISTDMIVLADSCHPPRHKHAALSYNINTIECYLLDRKKNDKKIQNNTKCSV